MAVLQKELGAFRRTDSPRNRAFCILFFQRSRYFVASRLSSSGHREGTFVFEISIAAPIIDLEHLRTEFAIAFFSIRDTHRQICLYPHAAPRTVNSVYPLLCNYYDTNFTSVIQRANTVLSHSAEPINIRFQYRAAEV